jgi:hypothetical protein
MAFAAHYLYKYRIIICAIMIYPGLKFKMGGSKTTPPLPCGVHASSYARHLADNNNTNPKVAKCTSGIIALVDARVFQKCGRFISKRELVAVNDGALDQLSFLHQRVSKSAWAYAVLTHIAKKTGLQRRIMKGVVPEVTLFICDGLTALV